MDNPKQSPTILSLCTGYGGIEIGLERVLGKCTTLAYVEIEAFAIANLVNKMETGKMAPVPIWTDLKTFDAKPFRDCVDILTGGYPCQPFSLAGKGKAEEDPRHLWPFIRTIILHARPKQVFLENVLGHLSRGISEVLKDMEEMGYTVEAGIFSAVEVGATHQRKRVFILANSDDMRESQQERSFQEVWRRSIDSGQELGNSESNDKRWMSEPSMHRKGEQTRGPSCIVANNHGERLQKCWGPGQLSGAQEITCSTTTGSCNQWPAPRGCEQWEWEEPRTIRNTTIFANRHKNRIWEVSEFEKSIQSGKTESKLGKSINGNINRVDRLRLLGNGVVWQTAAKAYLTLSRKLNAN